MGIRAEESPRRAKAWSEVTTHRKTGSAVINPIFMWSADDVWWFIVFNGVPYCRLYDEGFERLGCIGCPCAGNKRLIEFKRWPKFAAAWKKAAFRLWESKEGTDWTMFKRFKSKEEFWAWYISNDSMPSIEPCGQREFDYTDLA